MDSKSALLYKMYAAQKALNEKLIATMRLTSGNLRDLAGCCGRFSKEAEACHDLADRLYNATLPISIIEQGAEDLVKIYLEETGKPFVESEFNQWYANQTIH